MKNVIYTSAGPIRVCNLWEFVMDVKKHELHKDIAVHYAEAQKNEYGLMSHRYIIATEDTPMYSKTMHTLQQNPISILRELKNTTTSVDLRRENILLEPLLEKYSVESAINFGEPTHFFSVGRNKYLLACIDDVILYVNQSYDQSLVCKYPNRSFNLYVPNLRSN